MSLTHRSHSSAGSDWFCHLPLPLAICFPLPEVPRASLPFTSAVVWLCLWPGRNHEFTRLTFNQVPYFQSSSIRSSEFHKITLVSITSLAIRVAPVLVAPRSSSSTRWLGSCLLRGFGLEVSAYSIAYSRFLGFESWLRVPCLGSPRIVLDPKQLEERKELLVALFWSPFWSPFWSQNPKLDPL